MYKLTLFSLFSLFLVIIVFALFLNFSTDFDIFDFLENFLAAFLIGVLLSIILPYLIKYFFVPNLEIGVYGENYSFLKIINTSEKSDKEREFSIKLLIRNLGLRETKGTIHYRICFFDDLKINDETLSEGGKFSIRDKENIEGKMLWRGRIKKDEPIYPNETLEFLRLKGSFDKDIDTNHLAIFYQVSTEGFFFPKEGKYEAIKIKL